MKSTTIFIITLTALLFLGCQDSNSKKTEHHYNGEDLIKQKCSICHNLDIPPKISDSEKAPPMFTVTVHLREWMKGDSKVDKEANFIEFVKSFVINPSIDKSYCKKEILKKYGLMPSQKGNVTEDELEAIAKYALRTYDQKILMEIMQRKNKIASLPPYKQVLELKNCKFCHINGGGKVAPLFRQIAKKYNHDKKYLKTIKDAIVNGSKGKWSNYHTPMRAYKDLTPKQLDGISRWILKSN